MRSIAFCLFALATVSTGSGQIVYQSTTARLEIASDGSAISLTERPGGQQRIVRLPLFAVKKEGRVFPASAVKWGGDLLRASFGASGVEADFRIASHPDAIVIQLVAARGSGIEEVRLAQLQSPLKNAGALLGARWDEQFTVCVMGLSERVNARVEGAAVVASVYPEYGMVGEQVAILATPTPRFLDTVRRIEREFRLPSPMLRGVWAKRWQDVRSGYLFTDLTETNVDETIRYAKLGGFRYILLYSDTWATSLGSYPINTRNFPQGRG